MCWVGEAFSSLCSEKIIISPLKNEVYKKKKKIGATVHIALSH